ncbi:DUF6584 family protein [Ulvibacter antarcticus]|uniref:Uncharacterized protein n=1 Tax=Ulvibacter antarcticus TaxID=442714 RepID=A0A3L9YE83_9FLAO|nr:DUF6584 family protein [Ulvibacter antarcticus]RMA56278.1 hypothetical protein BXY75_3399 [Ulvibacter antarcticus]
MSLEEKLAKIELDIQNGLKFKAADRLRNMINQYPNEPILWNRLSELYYESGFLASAGKYWILTEPTEDRIKKCVEIYEKSVNHSGTKILEDITFRGEKSKLSEFGRKKLSELESDSKKKSNYVPKFSSFTNIKKKKDYQKITFKDQLIKYGFYTLMIVILLLIIIGFFTVVNSIF